MINIISLIIERLSFNTVIIKVVYHALMVYFDPPTFSLTFINIFMNLHHTAYADYLRTSVHDSQLSIQRFILKHVFSTCYKLFWTYSQAKRRYVVKISLDPPRDAGRPRCESTGSSQSLIKRSSGWWDKCFSRANSSRNINVQ